MGPPCCVPLSSLKYFEVFPPLMTHDSWLFSNNFIHSISSLPKPILSNIAIKKWWIIEWNAFSISTMTKKPSLFKTELSSRRSDISLPP